MAYYLKEVLQTWSTPDFEWNDIPKAFIRGLVPGSSLGFWWDPENVPTTARRSKKKRIPDFFMMSGRSVASQRFKDLVEEFEPNTHQFFPVTLIDHDGSKVEPDYYIFNCPVAFDSILVEESGLQWSYHDDWRQPLLLFHVLDLKDGWKLSKPRIAGRHIWTDFRTRPSGGGFYVSDALYREIKKRKIRYFLHRHCEELEVDWNEQKNLQVRLDWEAEYGLLPHSRAWVKDQIEKYRERTGR